MAYVYIDWKTITAFVMDVYMAAGLPREDAAICTDVLLEADRRGIESHGCNRFKPIYLDRIKDGILNPVTQFDIVRETSTTAVIDGHDGMGQVIAHKSMTMAINKAKRYGMGMVAVRNSSHFGIAGYYASMAVDAGCVGLVGTNARPSIAPTYGVENMLGTNPLTFGMPTDELFPFLLDCATSITQRGTVEVWARKGEKTPEGMVVDQNGRSLTDSEDVLRALVEETAALTPLGGTGDNMAGYKGYGYATAVEILSAALQSGQYMKMLTGLHDGKHVPYGLGHFFVAIDCEAFMGLEAFKKTAGDILRSLRASKKAPGRDRILTAGEREYDMSLERAKTGVPVNESVQKELIQLRDEFGLTKYRFDFE